jgi:hypothetical protein
MYIRGYLHGSENGRVVTIAISCGKGNQTSCRKQKTFTVNYVTLFYSKHINVEVIVL